MSGTRRSRAISHARAAAVSDIASRGSAKADIARAIAPTISPGKYIATVIRFPKGLMDAIDAEGRRYGTEQGRGYSWHRRQTRAETVRRIVAKVLGVWEHDGSPRKK